jgi:hypothetical protein
MIMPGRRFSHIPSQAKDKNNKVKFNSVTRLYIPVYIQAGKA